MLKGNRIPRSKTSTRTLQKLQERSWEVLVHLIYNFGLIAKQLPSFSCTVKLTSWSIENFRMEDSREALLNYL